MPTPKALTIWLNGKRLGAYGPNLKTIALPPGPAVLTFRNDACCFEQVVRIAANDRPKALRVALPWKPGRVRVTITPQTDARVLIGSVVAQPEQPVTVRIPSYSTNGQTEVDVRVTANGFQTARTRVIVRANTVTNVPIALEESP